VNQLAWYHSITRNLVIFGGGLDFMMSPAMVLGAEFRHANYGAKTVKFNYPGVGAVPSRTDVAVRTKIYDNQILFRRAYML
jgi:hypothetical protein